VAEPGQFYGQRANNNPVWGGTSDDARNVQTGGPS